MTQEIILTIGLPASGKSYWADEYVQKHPEYVIVNRDDLRVMLQSRKRYAKFSNWREQLVTNIQHTTAEDALSMGKSVIVADTNLNKKYRQVWKDMADNFKVKYTEKLFTDTPLDTIFDRDKKREFPVGQRVIMRMFKSAQDEYWPAPVHSDKLENATVKIDNLYTGTSGKKKTVLVDLDGTACIRGDRGWYEWDKVDRDTVNFSVYNIVNGLAKQGFTIVYLSGRDGSSYDMSKKWLIDNKFPDGNMYMRKAKDNRKDSIIKEEIFNNDISSNYDVKFVIDDRPQVCVNWRKMGIEVIQIGNPYNHF